MFRDYPIYDPACGSRVFLNTALMPSIYHDIFYIFTEKPMKKLHAFPHYSDEALREILHSQTEIRAFRDWKIIYSVQTHPEKKSEEIASILGIKNSKV